MFFYVYFFSHGENIFVYKCKERNVETKCEIKQEADITGCPLMLKKSYLYISKI